MPKHLPRFICSSSSNYMRVVCFIIPILVASCATLPEKIQKNIYQNDFSSALILLEEKGVGAVVDPKADEEELAARNIYENGVNNYYRQKIDDELSSGNLRQAYQYSLEAKTFCPWSSWAQNESNDLHEQLQRIKNLEIKWKRILGSNAITLEDAYEIKKDVSAVYNIINDTPFLVSTFNSATKVIVKKLAEGVKSLGEKLTKEDVDVFENSLDDFPNLGHEKGLIVGAFKDYALLPKIKDIKDEDVLLNGLPKEALNNLVIFFQNSNRYRLMDECYIVVKQLFISWTESYFSAWLVDDNVSYAMIDLAEKINSDLAFLSTEQFKNSISTGHILRANRRSGDGKSAAISLLHLQRAKMLSSKMWERDGRKVLSVAEASLKSTTPVSASISVGGDPNISPILYDLLRNSFAYRVKSNTKSYFKWTWRSPELEKSDVEVYFSDIKAFFPSRSDLSVVNSKYLSHYQDVPNPQKEYLASRLQWAESSVNSAEWNYDSAVSRHNFNPTQLSLNNVNNAYNDYSMAVNTYNSILRQYNRTPSTISEPVFLAYTFEQGSIKSGWSISAKFYSGSYVDNFSKQLVDSDFVRLGSKYNDSNSNYRRDDGIDIDVSNEAMIDKLNKILSAMMISFEDSISKLKLHDFQRVEGEEKELLISLYQPFGPRMPKTASNWIKEAFTNFDLPSSEAKPRAISLARKHQSTNGMNLKQFVSYHEDTVCEIKHDFGRGTGTLISNDGLILTCAHVLNGSRFIATFHSGTNKGNYECKTVFVDEKNDVALVRAIGLKASKWATIRLKRPTVKGEQIIAIGNPGLRGGETNIAGATKGIVSNPDLSVYGTQRTVNDITIASGSSGGPVFSFETGELVGVVTAVWSAGLAQEGGVSSSGYFCLSAPAAHLTEWLGVRY
ncbi:S1C family serine protease [Desulfovibrio sp. Fe33]|uniref:S1C family serine protease n=1 Tax=Desulfovibrio sp. Fe33 TaxID=3020842 RepID=UPI00234CF108|nr:serine protease [Desulfovibrio sp. Fe33]